LGGLSGLSAPLSGATVYHSDGSAANVQALHNAASSGDTITLPAGTFTWSTPVTISKAVRLQGAGSGRIIARSTSSVAVGTGLKTFTTQSGLSVTASQKPRISVTGTRATYMEGTVSSYSGTTLVMNITSTGGSGTYVRWIISTNPTTVLINNAGSDNLININEATAGSVDVSGIKIAVGTGTRENINIGRVTNGKPVLIHDCWIESGSSSGSSIYCNSNRGVVWNCSFDSSPFSMAPLAIHMKNCPTDSWTTPSTMGAADTTGTSNFYVENCDFHAWLNSTDFDDNARAVVRHCLFNNAGLGTHGADTSNYGVRHWEVYDSEFVFNGYTNGTTFNLNWWFFVRGGTFVVTDCIIPALSSQDYGNKPSFNLTVMNLQRNGGPNPCWGHGTTNGANYPAPRQVGMGRVTGAAGNDSITYKGDSEPIYIWNITGPTPLVGISNYGGTGCTSPDTSANYIRSGRDYFVGTRKPGYHKYTYPHPLRSSSAQPPSIPSATPMATPSSPQGIRKNKGKEVKKWKWGKAKENSTNGVTEGQKQLGQ